MSSKSSNKLAGPPVQPCPETVMLTLDRLLYALGDPVRLEMVRRLAGAGEPQPCGALYEGIAKSTASHHFKVLREEGLIVQHTAGQRLLNQLRRREIDEAAPGVLDAILGVV